MRTFKDLLENILFFVVLARVIGKLRQIFKLSIIRENFGLEKLFILMLEVCGCLHPRIYLKILLFFMIITRVVEALTNF